MSDLRVVLPDQLDRGVIPEMERAREQNVLMAETGYAFGPAVHRRKMALLAAAGRHYAAALDERGISLIHRRLEQDSHQVALAQHVIEAGRETGTERIVVLRPGSWRELQALDRAAQELDADLVIQEDPHFFTTPTEFAEHASGRKRLVMEYFYREQRRAHGVLMDGDEPSGGEWNYDAENRESFGRTGPPEVAGPPRHDRDDLTRDALAAVERAFPGSPGSLDDFAHAVTPEDAREDADAFVANRLELFGRYQDAMWAGSPVLFHSYLSSSLNLRLLDPRNLVTRAEDAWRQGAAPLNGVEGFIRQILGWREFIRGIYYSSGSEYLDRNELGAEAELPELYRTGDTAMRCVADVIAGVLDRGYAHHLDAYDWVSAPNVIGMSQYADGGLLATKPYVASGKYINRMSNYCASCRFDPDLATGDDACPFTTLYRDFLRRHRERLDGNRRMKSQLANLDRKSAQELDGIEERAATIREEAP